ncbi:putative receptor-like protein kinase [Raphanus sativus]|uniref:non-specific serine/threonine protein kinase n=1 Tax=Raphanus sativus TaxID=3726 RepID=A0A9W3DBZ3_RAPSA|nr:probable receptor-like protein kinase At5g18500 [Raphanus sativus]XP_056861235.1 probable receptor-like protein kinase At5g18500 [Raphanus sativus]XP_056861236.1 probable receptor-like protein kinase At5g18500 [Raphanus sativus]KAJ4908150.1 putative receptor-like protein kinase [Raphanus sativus]
MGTGLNNALSRKYNGLELWEIIVIVLSAIFLIVLALSIWLTFRRKKSRPSSSQIPLTFQIPPSVPEEIKEIRVDEVSSTNGEGNGYPSISEKFGDKEPEKGVAAVVAAGSENGDSSSRSGSFNHLEKKDGSSVSSANHLTAPSPLSGLPEFSHLGWGHWFTLRDLQMATNNFSRDNIIGDGGYGVVYRGNLVNGTHVAVKKLLNNLGQADKDFRVEVEAIGHVRHKNLVRLLGYCMEGTQRMLVYEYVNNGNLEQWLRGDNQNHEYLTWDARMKILIGTAKALAYLHEAIEPKVVHRDIKSSNILIDDKFNSKISDFGLAKLLGADKSFITTRVMGTFGYVAPEYANSGLLNEKSDVYSFGVVVLEAITGRYPVDYARPPPEVHLVEWLKMMVQQRRSEEVVDPNLNTKPSTSALKRTLLTALRCVDPMSEKRPRMSQVARMLESEEYPIPREDRRKRRSQNGTTRDSDPPRNSTDTDKSEYHDIKPEAG